VTESLRVALVTDVFHGPNCPERLIGTLESARAQGADVAVLPELPLNDWCPVRRTRAAADVEPAGGSRQRALARAAREAGLAVLGGAIVENPITARRYNTAILFDAAGGVVTTYRKVHLPCEEGFWEADHYEAGDELARPLSISGFQVGIQVCSDVNRPESCHLLGAMGALAVLSPRATPPETFERWRYVLRANAVTSSVYVISVNRPAEPGSPVGGPSLAIAPDGAVLVETTEPVSVVTLKRRVVEDARTTYPGYLAVRAELYARGWSEVAKSRAGHADAERPYQRSGAGLSGHASIDTNPRQD
jgi:N-carbamoylputrescine amidase